MTKGNFVLIENGKIYMSMQFNGDMYPSCNGKYVYYLLKHINSTYFREGFSCLYRQ